jgi:uncharacterized protein
VKGVGTLAWREVAIEVARRRSTEESLELWGQSPAETPRFNYRWEHLQAVARLAERMGRQLNADMDTLMAAVWLHDIVKSHSPEQGQLPDAEAAAEEARRVLAGTDFPPSKLDAVYEAIRHHEGLFREQPLEMLEAAILWDADKLSKLGATYLVHNLPVRPTFDPIFAGKATDTDLMVRSLERWVEMGEGIVASMNTEPGRVEGASRLEFLRRFLGKLKDEWEKS